MKSKRLQQKISTQILEGGANTTNKGKALALINTLASGNSEKAKELLIPGYIQHNFAYGTSADTSIGSVAYLASDPIKTTVNNIRAFEDKDKIFLQTVYNLAGIDEQVAFDIFHFDIDGKIAEYWDNLAAKTEPNPSGHTRADGYNSLEDLDRTEENRELVKNFLNDVMQGKAPEKMPFYFNGDTYIQRNAGTTNGLSNLGAAPRALNKQGIQMTYNTMHQVLAEGSYVLAVSEGSLDGAPTSYYDLWRIRDGKVAEHWSIMKAIAEKDTRQNQSNKS